jgi:hypothetical protein
MEMATLLFVNNEVYKRTITSQISYVVIICLDVFSIENKEY